MARKESRLSAKEAWAPVSMAGSGVAAPVEERERLVREVLARNLASQAKGATGVRPRKGKFAPAQAQGRRRPALVGQFCGIGFGPTGPRRRHRQAADKAAPPSGDIVLGGAWQASLAGWVGDARGGLLPEAFALRPRPPRRKRQFCPSPNYDD